MTCKFWWGSSQDRKRIHWIKWSQLCKHKQEGGLGFKGIRAFNEDLLAKQGWKCITQPDSILTRTLKAKYFPKCDFLHAKPNRIMSYTWHSILQAGWILKKGGLWNIGNGKSVQIWDDNWLPDQTGHKIWSPKKEGTTQSMVHDLILPLSRTWNQGLISKLFYPFEAQQIQNIPIIDTSQPDEFCWPKTKEGVYTVKSGYQAIQDWKNKDNDPAPSDNMKENTICKILWRQKIPPKYTHLMWRLLNNGLPVRSNLGIRGISCNPLCPRCEEK
jgi:hypothetical protein